VFLPPHPTPYTLDTNPQISNPAPDITSARARGVTSSLIPAPQHLRLGTVVARGRLPSHMILQDNGVSPRRESSPKDPFPGRKASCGVVSVHLDLFFAQDIAVVIDSGVGWLNGSGRGTTRAEDAQGTPTQSHTSHITKCTSIRRPNRRSPL